MPETYISLDEASELENVSYETMKKRIQRNANDFKTKNQIRDSGGKEQVLIAVSSLSANARKAYRVAQKIDAKDIIIEKRTETVPWYVETDLNHYIENHKKQYYEAIELANRLQEFIAYEGADRTGNADRFALGIGVSTPTLYRYVQNILEANAWALRIEKEDGHSRDYFRPLSLCRKPKETAKFPSLTDEQKAVIENIWFDKHFAANLGTKEMLFEKFEEIATERGWEDYPSMKTISRYITYLMEIPGAESAHFLAANGTREWKNKMMLKGKRTTAPLKVMEYVVGDVHTFDVWVQYIAPNGKVKAIRPKLCAWEDMKSRIIMGEIMCENPNSQTQKESVVKMACSLVGGIPEILHIDNGKDFTARTMTGQNRKDRKIDFQLDSEEKGFYESMGIQEVGRSAAYQPWDKPIERFFRTACDKFSRWFDSYTGTLTGSKTAAKRQKDVKGMLERGELLTLEEFFALWIEWKETKYYTREHRGLIAAGEQWKTPIEVYENAPRYEKAAPPREFMAALLMKAESARVTNQGITKFGVLYTDYELCKYKDKTVGIRWDIDDVTKLYVYDKSGAKICEAVSAELLSYGRHCSQELLEEHMRKQKRQQREAAEHLKMRTMPYEKRLQEDAAHPTGTVGKIDLTIKAKRSAKVVTLPNDKEYRQELAASSRRKKSGAGDEYLAKKAGTALARLRAINE